MNFMSRVAEYTWQDYRNNEDILSELKINRVVKTIQNYVNKCIQHIRGMDRDRLPHLTANYQPKGKRSQGRHLNDFSTVNGIGTGHEAQNPRMLYVDRDDHVRVCGIYALWM
jgi:hypothetical protein